MTDDAPQWQAIIARHRQGRQALMLYLVLPPALVYLLGHLVARMRDGLDPVWFYALSVAGWFVGLVYLIEHYEPYVCPGCGSKVYPSGAVSMLPLPCWKCGLRMPISRA